MHVYAQLILRQSGRMQLQIGKTFYDLVDGVPLNHVQQFVAMDSVGNRIAVIGQVSHRMVARADLDSELTS